MSANAPEYDGPARRAVKYVNDEPGEVSLPGELNAVPSIVGPGDVFVAEGSLVDRLVKSDRFEEVDLPEPTTNVEASPNAKLTKAELGEKLGLDEAAVESSLKDDLVAQADERDPVFVPTPEPEGGPASGDDTTEDTPA